MKCPYCGVHEKNQVVDSRETHDGARTRRRRVCLNCDRRFTTHEEIRDQDTPYKFEWVPCPRCKGHGVARRRIISSDTLDPTYVGNTEDGTMN